MTDAELSEQEAALRVAVLEDVIVGDGFAISYCTECEGQVSLDSSGPECEHDLEDLAIVDGLDGDEIERIRRARESDEITVAKSADDRHGLLDRVRHAVRRVF